MLIADLKQTCTTCNGSGFHAGYNQYGTLLPSTDGKCLACKGMGYLLTELGEELWALLHPLIVETIQQEKKKN